MFLFYEGRTDLDSNSWYTGKACLPPDLPWMIPGSVSQWYLLVSLENIWRILLALLCWLVSSGWRFAILVACLLFNLLAAVLMRSFLHILCFGTEVLGLVGVLLGVLELTAPLYCCWGSLPALKLWVPFTCTSTPGRSGHLWMGLVWIWAGATLESPSGLNINTYTMLANQHRTRNMPGHYLLLLQKHMHALWLIKLHQ